MKKLPLGIQDFRKIQTGGYVYVDKTQYVHSLINDDAEYFFLSRPRRFGKSLLLDTIAEAFSGDRELFKGLYLYDSGWGFEKHPVIRLDMSKIANETPEVLKRALLKELNKLAIREGLAEEDEIPAASFSALIEGLHDKYDKEVVVLIDEYDKPILDHIMDADTAEANRAVMKSFLGVLKSMDPHLRMTFITGVTKFTKTSVFSELNNLFDITLAKDYSNICGIPTDELEEHFGEHIRNLSSLEEFKHIENIRDEIIAWYDGYSWDGKTRVVNPFSLLSFFRRKSFDAYWYSSGTPTFLIRLLKANPESFMALSNLEINESDLDTFDIHKIEAEPLLFQSGYLTVAECRYMERPTSYLLKIPNKEVSDAFYMNIVTEFTGASKNYAKSAHRQITESLMTGNLQGMLENMRGLFATIPYELIVKREAFYHAIAYSMLKLLGFNVQAEVSVYGGRIDATLELGDRAYVTEFKYRDCDPSADDTTKSKIIDDALSVGMAQIKEKGYADKYAGSGKKVMLVAFAFLGKDDIEMRTEDCC